MRSSSLTQPQGKIWQNTGICGVSAAGITLQENGTNTTRFVQHDELYDQNISSRDTHYQEEPSGGLFIMENQGYPRNYIGAEIRNINDDTPLQLRGNVWVLAQKK